jgi:hypothetical protein
VLLGPAFERGIGDVQQFRERAAHRVSEQAPVDARRSDGGPVSSAAFTDRAQRIPAQVNVALLGFSNAPDLATEGLVKGALPEICSRRATVRRHTSSYSASVVAASAAWW